MDDRLNGKISSVLRLMADMNDFGVPGDRLSAIADSYDPHELNEEDLNQVFAAYSPMKYDEFIKKAASVEKDPLAKK